MTHSRDVPPLRSFILFAGAGNRVDDAEPRSNWGRRKRFRNLPQPAAPVATGRAQPRQIAQPRQPQPPTVSAQRAGTSGARPGSRRVAAAEQQRSRRSDARSNVGNTIVAFGPKINNHITAQQERGELSYHKPDKGSFEITEINTFKHEPQPAPAAAGPGNRPRRKGDWVKQPEAIGEHWVCDGKSIYEYRHDRQAGGRAADPTATAGQAIVDGPLPFLFGAEAAKVEAALLDEDRRSSRTTKTRTKSGSSRCPSTRSRRPTSAKCR